MNEFINQDYVLQERRGFDSVIFIHDICEGTHVRLSIVDAERLHHLLGVWLQEKDSAKT